MDIDIVGGHIHISKNGKTYEEGYAKNDNSLDFGAETPQSCSECDSDLIEFITPTTIYTAYCQNCDINYGESS
tara:strand:+ start:2078 stop:2296 length:219 start_codon:yes stop_codon:yes gene_type:complete